jgi:L-iditol 2-dehydrogenase
MKTKSACLTGVKRIEARQRELTIGPDEVLVKTHLAGICGQDKNLYHGIIPPSGGLNTEMRTAFAYPYFLGHEGGGTVVAVGEKVRDFAVGDRVISFGWIETISEYFKGKEEDLEKVPEGMAMDLASLGEPIGCAIFSGLMSKIQLGDVVAVFGMGFAGQIMAQVAKAKGACRVIGVDVVDGKLALAKKLGLDYAVNGAKEDPLGAVMEITGGLGSDVVVDMAGSADSVNLCTASVRHNGILVFYSWITQDITVNISRWHNNSLEVINTGLVHHGIRQRALWTPWPSDPCCKASSRSSRSSPTGSRSPGWRRPLTPPLTIPRRSRWSSSPTSPETPASITQRASLLHSTARVSTISRGTASIGFPSLHMTMFTLPSSFVMIATPFAR